LCHGFPGEAFHCSTHPGRIIKEGMRVVTNKRKWLVNRGVESSILMAEEGRNGYFGAAV
jgi:hypothetical protein